MRRRLEHGHASVTMSAYLATGHPWEALFENWESEFLQMAIFVLLTTFLVQKGSPESRRPGVKELVDADPRDFAGEPDVPWPVRRGGWVLRVYEHSLGLAFVLLFMVSWIGHAAGGFAEYAADQLEHGQPRPTLADYLTQRASGSSRSRTGRANSWRSPSMVWLAVYLSQRWSPESKPVHAATPRDRPLAIYWTAIVNATISAAFAPPLVAETMKRLAKVFADERRQLESQWIALTKSRPKICGWRCAAIGRFSSA